MLLAMDRRRRFRLSIIAFLLLFFTFSLTLGLDSASARRKRSRKKAIPYRSILLIEANTGRVLKARNERLPTKPASVVKMMTALITMEQIKRNIINLDDIITTSRRASRIGGQQVYLKQGEKFSLRDLMKSIIISSANDSSYAVAEHIAGDAEAFVDLMNQRAKELGMSNTRFVNVNGLPPGGKKPTNQMSARDAGILARELIKYPLIMKWSATKNAPFRNGSFILTNTNTLLGRFRGMDGLKTGYHRRAGFSIVATAKRKNLRLIAVVMGSSHSRRRFKEATRLLAWGFNQYRWINLSKTKKPKPQQIKVLKGQKRMVRIRLKESVAALVRRSEEKRISMKLELPKEITAPVKAGQKVGRVTYELGGNKLGGTDLVAVDSVKKLGFFQSLIRFR
ncbi:MAG: D-alanyl-D-alanine carboxypeptidase [Nitrospinae bacterium]|nr:D-alanyl-D-alanine carboxypeptidase [Nitrospinota bacterium]